MRQQIIELNGVMVARGRKTVLEVARLQVERGELVSIIGPNGAGKSTLLQVINGLLPIRAGQVRILDGELADNNVIALRRRSAMVFQEPLFIQDTVYDNVALPLRLRRVADSQIKERVNRALTAFRCDHLSGRLAQRLSGGESQRVCLARAFVTDPELLLLDEPFTALDPATRLDLLQELRQAALAQGTTVLLISHNLEDVLHFAQRAVVMEAGRIVQDDRPEMVMRRPVTRSIARLVGMDNLWPCQLTAAGQAWQIDLGEGCSFVWRGVPPQGEPLCCIPGDAFGLGMAGGAAWQLTVEQVIPGIGVYQVRGRVGGLALSFKLSRDQAERVVPGAEITVSFDPAAVHLIGS